MRLLSRSSRPSGTRHCRLPDERKKKAGLEDGLIRLSVGIENLEDLIDDLMTALSR